MPSAAKLRCNDKFEKVQGKERKGSGRYASALGNPPASAYNPASGTFHMLDTVVPESGASVTIGRYRSIDEIHENNSVGGSAEYDSNSNNGSYSGESDDQLQLAGKDKFSIPRLAPPGLFGGSDKREKIRMKNERKHQRQKERRAKELKDRCIVYLMSRKLEGLTQQLVAMGFPSDRVTMALILNEGDMEKSVALLLEGGDGQMKEHKIEGDANIDISEELARIAEIEFRYKYQRPEIERTIVACEGDIDKAAEILRDRYRNALSPVSPKLKSVQESYAESQGNEQGSANIPVPNRMSSKLSLQINSQKRNDVSGYGTVQIQQPSAGISRLNGEAFASKQAAGSVLEWCKSPSDYSQQGLNSKGKAGISLPESSNPSCLPVDLRQPIVSLQQSAVPSRQLPGIVNTASSPSGTNSSIGPPSSTFYSKVSDVFPKARSTTKTITIPEIFEASGSNQAKQEMPLWRSLLGSTFESQPKSTQVLPSGWTSWDSGLSDISREWNIGHLQNCDYRAIDWSMGMSPSQLPNASLWDLSHGLAASLNSDMSKQGTKSRDGQDISWNSSLARDTISTYELWGNPMLKGVPPTCAPLENTANKSSEISALGMQEWTSPFAGKDLITLTNWAVPSPSL